MKFLLIAVVVIVGVFGKRSPEVDEATRKASEADCQLQVLLNVVRSDWYGLSYQLRHESDRIDSPQLVVNFAKNVKTTSEHE